MTLSLNVQLGFLLLSPTLSQHRRETGHTQRHTRANHTHSPPRHTHIRITANRDKPDHIYFPPEDFLVWCSFPVKS